jgi:nucleotidyltransferase AbiEii toxin of type IV toxin-antitoxin system
MLGRSDHTWPTADQVSVLRPGRADTVLYGYPIGTVLAEQIGTAVSLGEANTRIRDYVDIHTVTGRHELSYADVRAALDTTASHRGVPLAPLSDVVGDLAATRRNAYAAVRADAPARR